MSQYQIQANLTFDTTIKKVALKVTAQNEDDAKAKFTQKAEAHYTSSLGKIVEIDFKGVDRL
ncbi:hypothetical protein MTBPR1_70180 [Candidatus Terasakiella magnetica]|uniref:Uncharacterized protein n=1 Tax=Candidatus Terasakiella magnetica TaxID=1867952 RepID=A0A1C3RKX5_9PROT|nr:hypothetical protein [Candidatus Terasakiella magnetica]SCA57908.1 hypothetical protein MTBPR1_70180 [Candidatus Terasakiella magnetica]